LSTLALDESSGLAGSSPMATALRYLDLVLLAAALPVFIATGLPMAAYIVVAGVWGLQYAIELGANRAIAGAAERRDRKAVMGWIGATGLARAWIVALAVLLVGLLDSKHAGLAAAVLALVLFTVHLGSRVILRVLEPTDQPRSV
jgi:hypothetical protein